jgi:hypothetical protein
MLTTEQIEAAWEEVKLSPWPLKSVELNQTVRHKFARAVADAALEEAAKTCDEMADGWNRTAQGAPDDRYDFMAEAGDRCADEIRDLKSEGEPT